MALNSFMLDEDDVALQRRVNDLLDWGLLLAVAGVVAMGLISIYSAAYGMGSGTIFKRQLIFAGIGIAAASTFFFIPERWMSDLAYPMYGIGILLLLAVLTPLGHVVNGQRCWIQIGSFSFQPSELAKLTTLMAVARYTGKKGFDIRSLRDLMWVGGMFLLPVGLIMLQPDTGSATVFLAMMLGVYLWTGGDLFILYFIAAAPFVAASALYGVLFDNMVWFAIVAALVALGAFLFRRNLILTIVACAVLVGGGLAVKPVFNELEPCKQNRLITLFEPERNPRGTGYHVIQSILAVGSGGVTGKGFLKRHTDAAPVYPGTVDGLHLLCTNGRIRICWRDHRHRPSRQCCIAITQHRQSCPLFLCQHHRDRLCILAHLPYDGEHRYGHRTLSGDGYSLTLLEFRGHGTHRQRCSCWDAAELL
ncbi:MAG: FtsW/RodA/SpoVE family cell cycle protein [Ignavibacteria bacterium]|nr:FtsW/RodA/SpoVE family cell cycle protein [Ignavibacteria bacterium]